MCVIFKVSGFKRMGSAEPETSSLYKLFTAADSAPSAISMFTWKFSEKFRNIPPRGLASIRSNWLNGMYAIFSSLEIISKNLSFTRSTVSMRGGLGREQRSAVEAEIGTAGANLNSKKPKGRSGANDKWCLRGMSERQRQNSESRI